jgi:trehalose 6-phosphate phosphatase
VPDRAGVLLDFDGTLAPIVSRPELARPEPGAAEVLRSLAGRLALVAIVTGRQGEEVRRMLDVPELRIEGVYGLEGASAPASPALRSSVEAAARDVVGAWVEDKGVTLAVHVRGAADPEDAMVRLRPPLETVAATNGMRLVPGKLVLELVPAGRPMKGEAVRRLVQGSVLAAALYAGDDVADLDAFEALRRSVHEPVCVAVMGPETPPALPDAADLVVDGPVGLVELLRGL